MIKGEQEQTHQLTFDTHKQYLSQGKSYLLLKANNQAAKQITLNRSIFTIGNHADCDLQLSDPYISGHHVTLRQHGESWVLKDQGSTNGTYVNNTKIKQAPLKPGTIIRIGKSVLTYQSQWQREHVKPIRTKQFEGMVGSSACMQQLFGLIEKVAKHPINAPILVQGETGSGKELVARALHHLSARASKPFIAINCGAIVKNLIESELFGHERGAFTGALQAKKGAFECADGGTLFLDEIGELPLELQATLLRVLENQEVTRVGSRAPIHINVQVIAATHRNLEQEIAQQNFREDLFYRLYGIPCHIPALRERTGDIPSLAQHILSSVSHNGVAKELSAQALKKLQAYHWPGNVRELKNVLQRGLMLCDNNTIEEAHIQFAPRVVRTQQLTDQAQSFRLEEMEKLWIMHVLKQHNGNKQATAKALGVAKSTLFQKLKKYALQGE